MLCTPTSSIPLNADIPALNLILDPETTIRALLQLNIAKSSIIAYSNGAELDKWV